ncbi:nitrilase-related carbon-nitrogen hydrolase [Verminephrobacter eiseniae]|uniref:nitrilase-related carbon-nitrogen hydrolase n=1 Tax=Verminephrobacter eiseniae TaxID=364317 RepID=UPI002238C36B|nr:nitrilase-related carbon-nitrogen hydrolase [Verminephrobacter eiseniae]MCW5236942.1 nitrilase [Verminephrobacter eiseniae]
MNQNLIKVAAAQIDGAYGDIGANLSRHLGLIAQARASAVGLLVFPELSLCGHSAGKDALRLAMARDDPVIDALAEASTDLHTVFGFIEEAPAGQFYNSQATVANGKLIHVHRKVQLATYGKLRDGLYYAAGTVCGSFPLDARWQMATPICADLWNPALVHALACDGATLLAAPVSSAREAVGAGFDNPSAWDINLRFYALTYGVAIVMANRVGNEGMMSFWGGSRILDPFGKTVALGSASEEGLIIGEIDYESVRQARFLLPTVRDARALRQRAATHALAQD